MTGVALTTPARRITAGGPFRGRVVRTRYFSARLQPRGLLVLAGLTLAIATVGLWSVAAGDFPLTPGQVVGTLFGQGDPSHDFIIFTLRVPRLLTGLMTGVAFGLSGAIFQSLARNPLASPDVIGFDAGAALGAVTMIIVFGATGLWVTGGAVAGGLCAAFLVFVLSWNKGVSPLRMILVGIGIGFSAYAGVEFLMTRSDIFEAASAQLWLTGSLNARTWTHVATTAVFLAVLVPITLAHGRALDMIELGDEMAAGLGISVNRTRGVMVLVGVLLSAVAVAAAGPLAFVAFVAGPIARRLTDRSGTALAASALVGALIVIGADLMGRLILAPAQLPAGVFTAVLGAPYLLWLLVRQMRNQEL